MLQASEFHELPKRAGDAVGHRMIARNGHLPRHSIGTGIIGGMVGATSLALFFVPLFYYLIITTKEKLSGGRPAPEPSAEAQA